MKIRQAVTADLDALVCMGRAFIESTTYGAFVRVNEEQMRETASRLIDSPKGALFVVDDGDLIGMIGMVMFTHHISGDRVAGEVFWWMQPERRGVGVRLVRAAEKWAAEQEASAIQMIAPTLAVGTLYERLGYIPAETTYQRALGKGY